MCCNNVASLQDVTINVNPFDDVGKVSIPYQTKQTRCRNYSDTTDMNKNEPDSRLAKSIEDGCLTLALTLEVIIALISTLLSSSEHL